MHIGETRSVMLEKIEIIDRAEDVNLYFSYS